MGVRIATEPRLSSTRCLPLLPSDAPRYVLAAEQKSCGVRARHDAPDLNVRRGARRSTSLLRICRAAGDCGGAGGARRQDRRQHPPEQTSDDLLAAMFAQTRGAGDTGCYRMWRRSNAGGPRPEADGFLRYIDISSASEGRLTSRPGPLGRTHRRARRRVQAGDTLWSTVRPNRRSHALTSSMRILSLSRPRVLAVITPKQAHSSSVYEASADELSRVHLVPRGRRCRECLPSCSSRALS